MKIRYLAVGMIVLMATSAMVWAAETGGSGGGNAGTKITESIIYAEGVDLDSLPVEPNSEFPAAIIGPAENIEINWADNLIYTQFAAGSVVRVEATFHNLATDKKPAEEGNPAVYSIRTHLKIEKIDEIGQAANGEKLEEDSIAHSLTIPDNEREFYSEINQEGKVIYGFNWDTIGLEPGCYRITFSFEKDQYCPDDLTYNALQLTSHAQGDHEGPLEEGVDFYINDDNLAQNWCSLDITLLEKDKGGRH